MCIENSEVREEGIEDVIVLQGPKSWKLYQPCQQENHYLCSEETQDSRCLCLCHEIGGLNEEAEDQENLMFY